MDKWIDFYEPFFPNRVAAQAFVTPLEAYDLDSPRHKAKIMMHQAQRLISLADDIATIRPEKESLQLLFLLVCAENMAKLFDSYEEDGKSRAYVRKFFSDFVVGADRQLLESSFVRASSTSLTVLTLGEVVDILYSVRCDVVHEGRYWGFQFHDGETSRITGDPPVKVSIQLNALRNIVVRACIRAVETVLLPNTVNHLPL